MKRRSARPFTVEIKHTRTSRTSLADATARTRSGQDLWQGQSLVADDRPAVMQPMPTVHSQPARPEAAARRVLPSLVPMFAMPVEPEAAEVPPAPVVERLPRVRRVKPQAQRKQASVSNSAPPAPANATAQRQTAPAIAAPAPLNASALVAQPVVAPARTSRLTQQAAALRPGERWKRRLPRALW
jgi:hypothetical protein